MMTLKGILERSQIPPPPADAVRFYGEPPYRQGGYVIDDGDLRWRYRDGELIGFMIYAQPNRERNSAGEIWSAWWFCAGGY